MLALLNLALALTAAGRWIGVDALIHPRAAAAAARFATWRAVTGTPAMA